MPRKVQPQQQLAANEYTLETYEKLLDVLYDLLEDVPDVEKSSARAGQAIAVIALADQYLTKMPVEAAFQYRQLAKTFAADIDDET